MMRAALLCLVVALAQAETETETEAVKCEDTHDIAPPDDFQTWGKRVWLVGRCGWSLQDDLQALGDEIKTENDWEATLEKLDEIVEKTSKLIFHARLLFGPLVTMPSDYETTWCKRLNTLVDLKGSAATADELHEAVLADAKCFTYLVKRAFIFKFLDPRYSQHEKNELFFESMERLQRLMHDGHQFHTTLSKVKGGKARKSTDVTDPVSDDFNVNALERMIKALASKP